MKIRKRSSDPSVLEINYKHSMLLINGKLEETTTVFTAKCMDTSQARKDP